MSGDVMESVENLEASLAAAKAKAAAAERRVLAIHDANHAYLPDDHPDVLACIWCQS